jgi:hypothetical protein
MLVRVIEVIVAGTSPIRTDVKLETKPVPLIVAVVPPAVDPFAGEIALTVGLKYACVEAFVEFEIDSELMHSLSAAPGT